MIARHDTHTEKADVWSRLAEPLPNGVVYWRQDGKVITRDGKHFARFVAYIEANTARERLDAVVPGEWDLTLELLPPLPGIDENGDGINCSFKARLQILGVIREDVGTGRDYKSAATDAFKRAAVRFGIAHELYAYEQNWVQVDSDGRYAKPIEDPGVVYARKFGATNGASMPDEFASTSTMSSTASSTASDAVDASLPSCPKCGGRVWDNRLSKRNPKAPDYKCRDRSCDGVIWPGRNGSALRTELSNTDVLDSTPLGSAADEIPF